MRLFSNRSQRMSKCGKNISDTLSCASCAAFLFLPHFDVIYNLLLNRRTAIWNLFVKYTWTLHVIICRLFDTKEPSAWLSLAETITIYKTKKDLISWLYWADILTIKKSECNVDNKLQKLLKQTLNLIKFCWNTLLLSQCEAFYRESHVPVTNINERGGEGRTGGGEGGFQQL